MVAVRSCLIYGCLLLTLSCGGNKGKEPPVRPVKVHTVQERAPMQRRTFAGIAHANVESKLSFRVDGTVQHLSAKVGDTVRSNQLIAAIDPKDYELQVEEAEAALLRARAEARHHSAQYVRTRALYESQTASRTELDAARAGSEGAKAAVVAATKRLQLARRRLQDTRLHAPTDGQIASVFVEENENVAAGHPIVQITSGVHPEVVIAVPEFLIGRIQRGDRVAVRFDAFPDQEQRGTVTEVGVATVGTSTTFPVTVAIDNADRTIRSGMAAEVSFLFPTASIAKGVTIPSLAVSHDNEGCFVYRVIEHTDGRCYLQKLPVVVGDLTSEGIVVLQGIEPGDSVVAAGMRFLDDGMCVARYQED